MAEYNEMCYRLFRLITEANKLLQEAQRITEAILLAGDDSNIKTVEPDNKINLRT